MTTFYYIPDETSILHHGVKGQHWGERRYQNKDGTWTEEGKIRRRGAKSKRMKTTEELKKHYPSYDSPNTAPEDLWQLHDNHPNYHKQVDSYVKLQKAVENTSWDWYNNKPVSNKAKALYKKYQKQGRKYPYENEMLGIALNDLGYENTKAGRDYIRNVVIWD